MIAPIALWPVDFSLVKNEVSNEVNLSMCRCAIALSFPLGEMPNPRTQDSEACLGSFGRARGRPRRRLERRPGLGVLVLERRVTGGDPRERRWSRRLVGVGLD